MADWKALPDGLVALIARKFMVIEDLVAFRSACSPWRKATILNDFYTSSSSSSCPKLPLLMKVHIESIYKYMKNSNLDADDAAENDPDGDHVHENNGSHCENDTEASDEIDEDDPVNNPEFRDEVEESNSEIDYAENDPKANETEDDYWNDAEGNDEIEIEEDSDAEVNHENNHDHDERVDSQDLHDNNDDDGQKFVRLIRRDDLEAYDERKFLSLSKGNTCNVSFPELNHTRYRGSKGWLIMVKGYDLCLFHPISRVRIPLPKLPTQTDSEGFVIQPNSLTSVALAASPSETCDDYVVMVAFSRIRAIISPGKSSEVKTYTGFWKPGNLTWRDVDLPYVLDLSYYNGKFYALTNTSHVWMCEASGPNPTTTKIVELPWGWSRPDAQLVECGGILMIVAPYFSEHWDRSSLNDLEMVEINVIKGSYKSISSLGSYAVFLGDNQGFSIDANTFPGIIEPNSIYFGNGSYQIAKPGPNHEAELNWGSGIWLNF